jgi:hypothetical protein
MIHHRDEQVQQHHDIDDRIAAEHQHAPESSENLDSIQFEAVQVHESEHGPEKRLYRFPEAVN